MKNIWLKNGHQGRRTEKKGLEGFIAHCRGHWYRRPSMPAFQLPVGLQVEESRVQTGGAPTPASAPRRNLWEAGRLTKVQRPEPPPGPHRPPGSSRAFEGSSMFLPGLSQTLRTQIPQWFTRFHPFTHYLVIFFPPRLSSGLFLLYTFCS